MQKKNHKTRMLEWIDELGLIVVQSEIKPYGPGTRRYMVGRHTEEPKYTAWQMPSGKWASTSGVQEWLTPTPLSGPDLEAWLTEYAKNL
jgi:hypothetical protein